MDLTWPAESNIELPLLRAILRRGGSIRFSDCGEDLERELADHFHLSKEHRTFASPEIRAKGNRKWRNVLQWVRAHLVDKGDLDGSKHDWWTVTACGRLRCGEPLLSRDEQFERDIRAHFPGMTDECILEFFIQHKDLIRQTAMELQSRGPS